MASANNNTGVLKGIKLDKLMAPVSIYLLLLLLLLLLWFIFCSVINCHFACIYVVHFLDGYFVN